MRDQYAGDISDFLKYALIRFLASDDYPVGVAWYFNNRNDGRPDGKHFRYPHWRKLDEPLWQEMDQFCQEFGGDPSLRTVKNLEKRSFWPSKTIFHGTDEGETVPRFKRDRPEWLMGVKAKLENSKLLFLDPDNSVHAKPTTRHASFEEIKELRREGRALLCIKFPARIEFSTQRQMFGRDIKQKGGGRRWLTLCTRTDMPMANSRGTTPRLRWFTLIDGDDKLETRLRQFGKMIGEFEGIHASVHSSEL